MSWTVIEIDGSGRVTVRSGGTLTGKVEPEPMAEPKPEPEPKLVTWRRCARMERDEIDDRALHAGWFPSGDIPDGWYPIEAQSGPVETIQQLPEGQKP